MDCSRHRLGIIGLLLLVANLTIGSATATAEQELPISLVSYDGVRPTPLAPDDPLMESVGVLFAAPGPSAQRPPSIEDYATAFLVSECHALAGVSFLNTLPTDMRSFGGSIVELPGVRFGIGLKPGIDVESLTEASFRASWPVSVQLVVPDEVDRKLFELTGWRLLRLEGCEPGARENGKPIAFDPITSLELHEAGLPRKARHIGALMTEELGLVELPCLVFGQIRHSAWGSTCSSWLGMMGGPVVSFDSTRNAWVAIGFIPFGNLALLLNPSEKITSAKQTFEVYAIDEKNPRYFQYTTNIAPMAQVWPWIRDSIERDKPGLIDAKRAGVAEIEADLRKSLLMQMQKRPREEWSAFDYTRFGIGLESAEYHADAAEFFRAAMAADSSYLPAVFGLSRLISTLGPKGVSDTELETVRTALADAIAQYPEDPQLILHRIRVEKKLALHKDMLADGEKYMAAEFRFPGSSPFHVDRGMAFLALGDLDAAEAAFAEAYELNAMDADAIRGMASVKLQRNDVEDGLRLAQKAVLVDSDDASARTVLAMALARHGDINDAIAAMEEACAKFAPIPTPYAYLAVLRGYKRALDGDRSNDALLALEEASGTYEDLWPRQMVDIFAGVRSVESIAAFDYSGYTPDWRRSIDIGRLVFAAAFDLSQGRSIDFAALEKNVLKYRDQNFVHLAPILKNWATILATRKQ